MLFIVRRTRLGCVSKGRSSIVSSSCDERLLACASAARTQPPPTGVPLGKAVSRGIAVPQPDHLSHDAPEQLQMTP